MFAIVNMAAELGIDFLDVADVYPVSRSRLFARGAAGGCNNPLDRRKVPTLEWSRGIWQVIRGHAINRRVKVVERLTGQRRDDFGAEARTQRRFMYDYAAASLDDRADHSIDIERNERSQVHHSR